MKNLYFLWSITIIILLKSYKFFKKYRSNFVICLLKILLGIQKYLKQISKSSKTKIDKLTLKNMKKNNVPRKTQNKN